MLRHSVTSVSRAFQSLSVRSQQRTLVTSSSLNIYLTSVKQKEALKKKRTIDPARQKEKDEKRVRKLMKALKKLEKKQRIPKPTRAEI